MGSSDTLSSSSRETKGSELSSETYYCADCGGRLKIQSIDDLQPCPKCHNRIWEASEQTRQIHNDLPHSDLFRP